MKSPVHIIIIMAIVVCIGTTVGFFLGVNEGIKQYFMYESSVKASLLTHELRDLRENNLETSITTKEIELDGKVVDFTRFQKEGQPWVLTFYRSVEIKHEKYMKTVAAYRKIYPSVVPTIDYSKNHMMKERMEQHKTNVVIATRSILNEFGE
ncbi:MAG: hypothetical protein K1564_11620 [Candidatus Thiodiazotropha sp. (ex. Lucinisca nassula)]|nr:hypothetical protein [Candidatus Thiodiazotropha sp. (ex. Lucinisca nassula)]